MFIYDLSNLIDISTITNNVKEGYIVQPFLEDTDIYAIDCLCINGNIEFFMINKAPPFFNENSVIPNKLKKPTHKIINKNNEWFYDIVENTTKIVEKTLYNGFIEVEYILDKTNNILYFLEINPRISGNIFLIDNKNGLIFLENFILRYINIFTKSHDIPIHTQQIVRKLSFYGILLFTGFIISMLLFLIIYFDIF